MRRRAALLLPWLAVGSVRAAPHEVVIRDHRFEPAELRIRAGDTVRWVNHEKRTSHSVLFPGLESERLLPGEHWERRFDKPGRYPYACGPHPEMQGLVIVD